MIAFEAANQVDGIEIFDPSGQEVTTLAGPWMPPPSPPTDVRAIGLESAGIHYFDWSPDSSRIAAITDSGLWLVPLDGTEPTLLGSDRYFTGVSWSPQGEQLAVSYSPSPDQPWESFIGLVNTNGDSEVIDIGPGQDAEWSPDGAWIAYRGVEETGVVPSDLFIAAPDTAQSRSVATSPSQKSALTWAPDGQYLVFLEVEPDTSRYGLISIAVEEGSTPVVLVEHSEDLYDTSWPGNDVSWQPVYP
jgi:dipeptidyl aminopeptidase/acylaminoacyl peptidase